MFCSKNYTIVKKIKNSKTLLDLQFFLWDTRGMLIAANTKR